MEQIGDIIERVLQDIEDKKIRKNRSFSDAGMAEICDLHERLVVEPAAGHERVPRRPRARRAEAARGEGALSRPGARIRGDATSRGCATTPLQSIETSSLHLDLISDLKRINSHICSIAYPILESAGALTRDAAEAGARCSRTAAPRRSARPSRSRRPSRRGRSDEPRRPPKVSAPIAPARRARLRADAGARRARHRHRLHSAPRFDASYLDRRARARRLRRHRHESRGAAPAGGAGACRPGAVGGGLADRDARASRPRGRRRAAAAVAAERARWSCIRAARDT